MITYLVIANGDSNKSYKCNTTHTSKPYIRINEHNYLDLTTETTTGVQLKYKQKTGSSYKTYNTTFSNSGIDTVYGKTTGYSNSDGIYTTSNYSTTESWTNSWINTTKSKETFKNRVYIPVQSQSTTVSTTKESMYTNTTGYSGRSTYNTTTYTTTGYSGRSFYNVDNRQTTGYSGRTSSRQTTGSGYRSTTSSRRTSSYDTIGTFQMRFWRWGVSSSNSWMYSYRETSSIRRTSKWSFQGGGSNSSTTQSTATTSYMYSDSGSGYEAWELVTATDFSEYPGAWGKFSRLITKSTSKMGSASYATNTRSWAYNEDGNGYPQQTGSFSHSTVNVTYTSTERSYTTFGASPTWVDSFTFTRDENIAKTIPGDRRWDLLASTVKTTATITGSQSITSRYATTDYSNWYPDFTATVTGTRQISGYSSATSSNGMYSTSALISGTSYQTSSYRTSTAVGALSSATALTSSGTRTSSSYKYSSKPGALVSITELTVTSTRTSLTNRTSSTDL